MVRCDGTCVWTKLPHSLPTVIDSFAGISLTVMNRIISSPAEKLQHANNVHLSENGCRIT